MKNKKTIQHPLFIPVSSAPPPPTGEEEKPRIFSFASPLGRILYFFSAFTVFFAVITLIVSIVWITQPTDVLVIKHTPVVVEKKTVTSGDVQIFTIDYCKHSDMQGVVSWQLISARVALPLPSYTDMTKAACQTIRFPMILPFIAHTDTYYIHWHVVYQINPLKTSTIDFDSQPFTIFLKP